VTEGAKSSGPRILVYEPDHIQRRLIDVVLRDLAFDLIHVDSIREATARTKLEPIDVVLVDFGFGQRDTGLVQDLVSGGVPVVVITADASIETLSRVRRIGATAVLTKPYQPTVLRQAIELATRTVRNIPVLGREDSNNRWAGLSPLTRITTAFASKVPSALERRHDEGQSRPEHLEDRLTSHSNDVEPSEEAGPSEGSTDTSGFLSGRLDRATIGWGVVALVALVGSLTMGVDQFPFALWVVITGMIVASTTWTAMFSNRSAYDPAFPLKVALGVAVGAVNAPIALTAQSVAAAMANGLATKGSARTTITNVGVIALEGFVLGLGLRLVLTGARFEGATSLTIVALGIAAAGTAALVVNFATVLLTLRYLTGRPAPWAGSWDQPARDIGLGTLLGVITWLVATPRWIILVAGAAFITTILWRLREITRLQLAAYEDLQSRVGEHERLHAELPDHTRNVVAIVADLVDQHGRTERHQAIAAAWFHSLARGGWPDRCSGGSQPPLWQQVRHLPRRWRLEPTIEMSDRVRHWSATGRLDVAAIVGLACTIDALRLRDGQLETLGDIQMAWGYPAHAIHTASQAAERVAGTTATHRIHDDAGRC